MTFSDIFPVAYATFCGVQLGESFVKRPQNIGAGKWMEFWDQLIRNYDDAKEDEISPHYVEQIESENEDLQQENDDLNDQVASLENRIEELEDALAEANYAFGQKFGDKI